MPDFDSAWKEALDTLFEPFMAFFFPAKLLDYAAGHAALEANANPFAVVVLAHLETRQLAHDDGARHHTEVRSVKGLYERGFTADQIRHVSRN